MTMHVETLGEGPRVVLVHGSMGSPGRWPDQHPLAERFRGGFHQRHRYYATSTRITSGARSAERPGNDG